MVSLILHHLSDMKYKDRRQLGPDQPVEFLEFRPTLVPSILVNKLWAEEGTSILWKRYPHLPALRNMTKARRQWYANRVERLFVSEPVSDSEDLCFLDGLAWPKLKNLELEIDWKRHEKSLETILHAGLEHLEILGEQTGGSQYLAHTMLPALFSSCTNLQSICFSPGAIDPSDPMHNQELTDALESATTVMDIRIMNANFFGKDLLFGRLSQRPGLEALQIDLDPGLQLLPLLVKPNTLPALFPCLRRLHVVCYPEVALALPVHLICIEELHFDVARIPDQTFQDSDLNILDDLLGALSSCQALRILRINVGQLSVDFPSDLAYPVLSGMTLVRLASGCPKLRDINLLASEPSAIDGSRISSLQFEAFCRKLPQLENISIKLHPQTAVDLESTAVQSLGRHCPLLEMVRLKIALQLPGLPMPKATASLGTAVVEDMSSTAARIESTSRPPSIAINGHQRGASLDLEYYPSSIILNRPFFPRLNHLAFARPQTVLSIASDTYTVSSTSQSSLDIDPSIEEGLVKLWALPLTAHFPQLDVLEAWSDWTGHDNESLNYFLPLEEALATTWEFLSGIEQDLWDDGEEKDDHYDPDTREQTGESEGHPSFDSLDSGDDWERASLVNEFYADDYVDDQELPEPYDDESDGMITPRRTAETAEEAYHLV